MAKHLARTEHSMNGSCVVVIVKTVPGLHIRCSLNTSCASLMLPLFLLPFFLHLSWIMQEMEPALYLCMESLPFLPTLASRAA